MTRLFHLKHIFKHKKQKILLQRIIVVLLILTAFMIGLEVGAGTISSLFTTDTTEPEKISKVNQVQQKARTALAELLRKDTGLTQDQTNIIINPECDELAAVEQAKACTYVIRTNQGHGSGFAIDKHYLITNKHVVQGASQIFTYLDREKLDLELWNYAQKSDLAVLFSSQSLESCSWTDSNQIFLAETLYAIGWPNTPDGESSITKGIFSRLVQTDEGVTFIQTDTAINPGNSGGPLVSSCGVIGINTGKISWSQGNVPAEGFSFAITGNYAQEIVQELIQTGSAHSLPIKDMGEVEYSFAQNQPTPAQPREPQYLLTEESKEGWLRAETITQELAQYWQQSVDELNTAKLEQLKDVIARMQAVLDTVMPKIKANQPLSSSENQLLSSWKEMYHKAIKLEGDLHGRDYTTGYAHLQCVGNSCALVAGRGRDRCSKAADCAPKYHFQCQDMTCVVVEGEGENQCTSHDDCYHYTCQEQRCVKVSGDGTDSCYLDWQCK